MSGPIKAVTLDVVGTLLQPWPSVGHVYSEVAREHGSINLDPAKLNRGFAKVWARQAAFDFSRSGWQRIVNETFREAGGTGVTPELFNRLYDRFAFGDVWQIYADVIPALDWMTNRGIRLGVVSNWDSRLRRVLNEVGLERYFAVCIISSEVGVPKPDKRIFQTALRELGLDQSADVLHIGDREDEDYFGATGAGFRAAWLQRNKKRTTGRVISSLWDIPRFIESPFE